LYWVADKVESHRRHQGNKGELDSAECLAFNAHSVDAFLNASNFSVKSPRCRGVSLPELLVVVALLVVLAGFGGSALKGMLGSSRRLAAIDQVVGWFDHARTLAILHGRPSFLVLRGTGKYASAGVFLEAEDPAEAPVPMMPWQWLPVGFFLQYTPGETLEEPSLNLVLPDGVAVSAEEGRCVKFSPTGEVLVPPDAGGVRYALKSDAGVCAEVAVSRVTGKVKVMPRS